MSTRKLINLHGSGSHQDSTKPRINRKRSKSSTRNKNKKHDLNNNNNTTTTHDTTITDDTTLQGDESTTTDPPQQQQQSPNTMDNQLLSKNESLDENKLLNNLETQNTSINLNQNANLTFHNDHNMKSNINNDDIPTETPSTIPTNIETPPKPTHGPFLNKNTSTSPNPPNQLLQTTYNHNQQQQHQQYMLFQQMQQQMQVQQQQQMQQFNEMMKKFANPTNFTSKIEKIPTHEPSTDPPPQDSYEAYSDTPEFEEELVKALAETYAN